MFPDEVPRASRRPLRGLLSMRTVRRLLDLRQQEVPDARLATLSVATRTGRWPPAPSSSNQSLRVSASKMKRWLASVARPELLETKVDLSTAAIEVRSTVWLVFAQAVLGVAYIGCPGLNRGATVPGVCTADILHRRQPGMSRRSRRLHSRSQEPSLRFDPDQEVRVGRKRTRRVGCLAQPVPSRHRRDHTCGLAEPVRRERAHSPGRLIAFFTPA